MIIKRVLIISLVLFFVFFSPLFADQTVDTVVLLDVSESMLPYFDSSVDYLIKDIIKSQLKVGDTFHLISFAGEPEFEISKRLVDKKDTQAVLSRILLLNPLGKYTDLISALYYVNNYVEKLPLETRKNILILTDGIQDPPPGSDYYNLENIPEKIHEITGNMIRQGWNVSLVRFPMQNGQATTTSGNSTTGGKSGVDVFDELSKDLGTNIVTYDSDNISMSHKATGEPLVIFPDNLGEVNIDFILPLNIKNFGDKLIQIRLEKVKIQEINVLKKPVSVSVKTKASAALEAPLELPDSFKSGNYKIRVDLEFSPDSRPYPREGIISFTLKPQGSGIFSPLLLKIFLAIAGAVLLTLLLIFTVKRLFEGSTSSYSSKNNGDIIRNDKNRNKGHALADRSELVSGIKKADSYVIQKESRQKRSGNIPLKEFDSSIIKGQKAYEMIVDNQNRQIGMRNIHWFKDGSKYTIGGTHADDYIIFIHKVDRNIAQVEMQNGKLYLNIIKEEYFPDASSGNLKITMPGNTVRLQVGDKIIELTLKMWISPLERVNRILHLTDSPGAPDFEY